MRDMNSIIGSFGDVKCAKRAFSDNDKDLYALKVDCFNPQFSVQQV